MLITILYVAVASCGKAASRFCTKQEAGCGRVFHKGCLGSAGSAIVEDDSAWACPLHSCHQSGTKIAAGTLRRDGGSVPFTTMTSNSVPPPMLSLFKCEGATFKYFKLCCCMFCPTRWLDRVEQPNLAVDPLTGVQCVAKCCEACSAPQGRLQRRIRYALGRIAHMRISGPLLMPVDASIYPDYYDTISHPICVERIEEKAIQGSYSSAALFLKDMHLLHRNCEQYCSKDFPQLVEASRLLFELARSILSAPMSSGIEDFVDAFHRRRMQLGGRQFLLQRLELELEFSDVAIPDTIEAFETAIAAEKAEAGAAK